MASVQEITSEEQYNKIISSSTSSTLLVLYFKASWAEPCAQVTTILETLASTYPPSSDPSSPQFLAIDAESLPDISESFDVSSVPFIVLQKDGKVVDTVSGVDAVKLRSSVEKYSKTSSGAGKAGLPPQLEATRPAAPSTPSQPQTQSEAASTSGGTTNLSKYAPTSTAPATSPEYSSNTLNGTSQEELNTRLSQLVAAAPVMLFMKGTPSAPQCGFSRQLVSILRENGVKYGFFNILADDEVRQGLKVYSDWPTFPQLYAKGELVGGLDIVQEELESDPDFFKEFSVKQGGPGITA